MRLSTRALGALTAVALFGAGNVVGAQEPGPAELVVEQTQDSSFAITRYSFPAPVGSGTGTYGAGTAALARPVSFDPPDNASMLLIVTEADEHTAAGGYTVADGYTAQGGHDDHVAVQLRTRTDGEWSAWTAVESAEEDAPDGLPGEEGGDGHGTIGLGPVWIGTGVEEVQVAHGDTPIRSIEALAPLDRPRTAAMLSAEAVGTTPSAAALVRGQPSIRARSAWTDRGFACGGVPSYSTNVRAGVVHHTVTTNTYATADVPAILRGIHRLHVDVNGWCDVAYNFLIDRFGTIWEGRSGGIDRPVIGGHTKGLNTGTFGVALIGQHQSGVSPAAAAASPASLASLEALIGWKFALHGVDPNGTTWLQNRSSDRVGVRHPALSWVEVPTLVSHRDLIQTSCPGSLVVPGIPAMRSRLMANRVGTVPHDFPAHRPYQHGPGFVTLDEFGGLRPGGSGRAFGGVPMPAGVRAIAVDGGPAGGYLLRSDGQLSQYGSSPAVAGAPAGGVRAVDLVVRSSGVGGWVLDANGTLHAFGGAPAVGAAPGGGGAVAADLDDNGRGYVVGGNGLHAVGGSPARPLGVASPVSVAVRSDRASGWVLDAGGRLHAFGGAPAWQHAGGLGSPEAVLVGSNDRGGWVVDTEGRIVPFGAERRILPTSTAIGVGHTTDAALVDWIADDRSALIRYVKALTTLFLGVPADPTTADVLASRVVFESRAAVIGELARSEQWAGQVIDQMYLDVLGRRPDAAGRTYWVQRLRSGLRVQDMGAHFYASPEYVRAAGSSEAYVTRLYRALLGRSPDGPGLTYWVGQLNAGRSPGDITRGFYQSPESRRARVHGLYLRVLGRGPDAAGHAFWAERLLVADDIALAIDLAGSNEYYTRVTGGGGPDD